MNLLNCGASDQFKSSTASKSLRLFDLKMVKEYRSGIKMNAFPDFIEVSKVAERSAQSFIRLQCLARQEIYELILQGDEGDYFALDKFSARYTKRDIKLTRALMDDIIKELHALGWKTQFSFGGTGLFIFARAKPSNCYDDGLI